MSRLSFSLVFGVYFQHLFSCSYSPVFCQNGNRNIIVEYNRDMDDPLYDQRLWRHPFCFQLFSVFIVAQHRISNFNSDLIACIGIFYLGPATHRE